ncbi:hypothetical protein [Pontibacter burrus]|uniref:Uncharacterized protein n=1 Tax=Pontibacter burrus TaxID=2704466 RepID=A0A6B3LQB4_9BACT|nr:hypothetical protein [Pontibacter burrus]NEM98033.1 hypothetical protein [Pontibacter burrus]
MKFTLALFILSLLCFTNSAAQNVSVQHLKNAIVAKHSINPDTVDFCDFIVVDGVPYSVSDIEKEIETISIDKLRVFMFIEMSEVFHHKKCDWLLTIGSGINQKRKEKKVLVNQLKDNIKTFASQPISVTDVKCDDCMAIVVDGKALDEHESTQFINNLKARNIAHIAFYKNANPDYHGYRARNGMMEIFLKD